MMMNGGEFVPSTSVSAGPDVLFFDDCMQTTAVSDAAMVSHSQTIDTTGSELVIPEGGFAQLATAAVDQTQRNAVCSMAFDWREELLWAGTSAGHVTSYYGSSLDKYTSFQITPDCSDVRALGTIEPGLLTLSRQMLKCHKRTGLRLFTHTSSNLSDMQCMLTLPNAPDSLVLGGYQQSLVQLDLRTTKETRIVRIQSDCTILRANDKFALSGDTGGNVTLRSLQSFDAVHKLEAHQGSLSDFDVSGQSLITCGFSVRMGQLTCDRFLMMYDLRTLRALPPISLGFEPSFIRFLPTYSDRRIVVASQMGEFQVFEIGENGLPYQVDTLGMPLFCMDVCSTKQAIAFGDGAGYINLFSDRIEPVFNIDSGPTVFADPVAPLPPLSFEDNLAPLSVIPVPFPRDGEWLSDWPEELCRPACRKPLPIHPHILLSMRQCQFVAYASNPGHLRRNQVPYDLSVATKRTDANQTQSAGSKLPLESPSGRATDTSSQVPKLYRKVRVKPSKFGSEEFKYGLYNSTQYSGIECNVSNAYCHAVLLALYHLPAIRALVWSHLCRKEACLACELSFVFKMLEQSAGKQPVLANNFIRALKTIPEAGALGLLFNDKDDTELNGVNLAAKIESFNRFLLQQLHTELEVRAAPVGHSDASDPDDSALSTAKSPLSPLGSVDDCPFSCSERSAQEGEESAGCNRLDALLSSDVCTTTKCKCGHEWTQNNSSLVLSLAYPQTSTEDPQSFGAVLSNTLRLEQSIHSFCEQCAKYTLAQQTRRITKLPKIMLLSTHVATDKDKQFLVRQQNLSESEQPPSATKSVVSDRFNHPCRYGAGCKRPNCRYFHKRDSTAEDTVKSPEPQTDATENHWIEQRLNVIQNDDGSFTVNDESSTAEGTQYDLQAIVYFVVESEAPHLVTCVREDDNKWVVFNEFVISRVSADEALHFHMDWKIPSLLFYMQPGTELPSTAERSPIDATVFWGEESLAARRRLSSFTFVPLEQEEIPKRGDIVAIDAEFVTVNQEEAELRSDGTRSMIKPSHMSLARVTCIRGNEDMKFIPFIDDYISTQHEVVDYLTKFSGIKPGDLDPSVSTKHLTTLKWTYLKLRYLVDNGIIFVGHGLSNDFRVINIVVPKEQVLDTVHLFHLPHNRMVSLRFLAWYFLGLNIQSDTHDSVEDARTALKLYDKYQELSREGSAAVSKAISELYDKGRQLQWKIPED